MSISPKTLFPCNHIVVEKTNNYDEIKMKRSYDELNLDRIPENTKIIRVDRVYSEVDNKEFFEGVHYEQNINPNIIEWLATAPDCPSLGSNYLVQCAFIKTNISQYAPANCPRCCGNGWYIDALSGGDEIIFTEGIEKLNQSFVKVIFTDKVENDDYGTSLKSLIGTTEDSSIVASEIMKSLRDAESVLKSRHRDNVINHVIVSPEETLSGIEIEKIIFARDEQAYYITVRIDSESDSSASFSFKV